MKVRRGGKEARETDNRSKAQEGLLDFGFPSTDCQPSVSCAVDARMTRVLAWNLVWLGKAQSVPGLHRVRCRGAVRTPSRWLGYVGDHGAVS